LVRIPRSQQAKYTKNLTGAHNIELSCKVTQSISDDPLDTVPASSSGAPAGTLLKVKEEKNTSLHTFSPSLHSFDSYINLKRHLTLEAWSWLYALALRRTAT